MGFLETTARARRTEKSLFDTLPAQVHAFEAAGLGKAPYVFEGAGDAGRFNQVPCQFCYTPIRYMYWLTSADGKRFYVGSECINNAEDAGIISGINFYLVGKAQKRFAHLAKGQGKHDQDTTPSLF
jgi:hypothetical protein